jgi:glycosyltransferase involved in cell wall biosynthesis
VVNQIPISVIIPVYNVAPYLDRAIKSLQAQTFENFEMIFVNDGSSDNSAEIIANHAENDSRIKLINQENQGVGMARNRGIDAAIGEYLYFCDPDDWVEPELLEVCYQAAKPLGIDLVFFGWFNVYGKKQVPVHKNEYKITSREDYQTKFIDLYQEDTIVNYVWSSIVRKDIIDTKWIRFPAVCHGEDFLFMTEVLKYISSLVSLDQQLYHYVRLRDESATTKWITHFDDLLINELEQTKALANHLDIDYRKVVYQDTMKNVLQITMRLNRQPFSMQYKRQYMAQFYQKMKAHDLNHFKTHSFLGFCSVKVYQLKLFRLFIWAIGKLGSK